VIRILHIIDTGGPGGAETVYLNTASGTEANRFRSTCLVSREGWLAQSLRARGIDPIVISASGSLNVAYLRQVIAIVRREDIHVIAAHLYGSAVYGSLAGLLTRTPVVSILHGQSDISKGGRFSGLKRFIVRAGSNQVVFVSGKLKAELAQIIGLPAAKCVVIPNGVDLKRFAGGRDESIRTQLGLKAGDILVGAVGNIRRPKAYEVLLRAAHLLRNSSDKYHFVIAGEGSNALHDELLKLRSALGLNDAVTFLGLRPDVANVLSNLDVYALSSDTEGFSIACIEAMAARIPVVATRSGGPEEILENERTGLLVPTQDPAALANGIARLAEDREFAGQLTRNALDQVENRYTLSRMLGAYQDLFQGLA
jgi:glycosyltransferase involved in cell wall biosynthesis